MILKQVIRYDNADAIEATWVETVQLPEQENAEDGTAAVALREKEVVVKCRAYSNHPDQIAQLRVDLGDDAAQYEDMIAEVAATYTPPPPVVVPVPPTCTRRQGRRALLQAGHLLSVEAIIANIPDPIQQMEAKIEYEADTWERNNAFLQAMWAQLGGTPEQLDDLFRLAVTF